MSRFKRLLASLSSVALVVTSILVFTPATQAATFSDVPSSSPFFSFIEDLASRGVISASRANYNPTMASTRGELVKIVVNATGTTINTTGGPTFSDVPVGSPFYTFVETAVNNGWVSGYGDGTFGPNNRVTRGEASKIIANAFGMTLLNPSTPSFADVSPSNVFFSYIETLAGNGIINGYANGTFGPNNPVLRQELAKVVSGAIAAVEGGTPPPPPGPEPTPEPTPGPTPAPTPSSNEITVRLSPSTPPARTVPQGGINITFLSFDVTAGNAEDVLLTQLIISRQGLGQFDDFDAVNVYDGITRIGSSRSFTSDDNIATFNFFNTPILVSRGTTKTVDIKGDLIAGTRGTATDRSGNQNYLTVESPADVTAVGVDTGGAVAVRGDFPVEGNPQQLALITIGTLTIKQGTTPPDSVNIGEQDADFGQLLFEADGREDILIVAVTLENKGSASGSDIGNVALFDNSTGEQLGDTVVNPVNDKAVFDLRGEPNGGLLIDDGDQERVNIRGDVNDGSVTGTDTIRFELDEVSDIIAIGQTFGFPVIVIDGREPGQSGLLSIAAAARDITIQGGQLTFNFQKPEDTDIPADTNDAIIAQINITNRGEGALVRDIFFQVFFNGFGDGTGCPATSTGGAGGAGCPTANATIQKGDILDNVEIVAPDGSIAAGPIDAVDVRTAVAACAVLTATCASDWEIRFTDDFVIPTSAETQQYRVKADIQADGQNGDVIQIRFTPFTATGPSTDLEVDGVITNDQLLDISPLSLIASDEILIQDESLNFSLSTTPVSDTVIRGNEYDILGMNMQAADSGDVIVTTLVFDLAVAGDVVTNGVTTLGSFGTLFTGPDIVIARLYDENGNLLDDDIVNVGEAEVFFDNVRPQILIESGGQRTVIVALDINSSAVPGTIVALRHTPSQTNVSAEDTEGDTLLDDQLQVNNLPGVGADGTLGTADDNVINGGLPLTTSSTGVAVFMTVLDAGALTVERDNETPDSAQVQAGADLVDVLQIQLNGTDENIYVEQVSISSDFIQNNKQVSRLYLFDGSTQVGDVKFATAETNRPFTVLWDFTGANRILIPEDGEKLLSIKVDFNVTNDDIAISGQGMTFFLANIEAEGSKVDITPVYDAHRTALVDATAAALVVASAAGGIPGNVTAYDTLAHTFTGAGAAALLTNDRLFNPLTGEELLVNGPAGAATTVLRGNNVLAASAAAAQPLVPRRKAASTAAQLSVTTTAAANVFAAGTAVLAVPFTFAGGGGLYTGDILRHATLGDFYVVSVTGGTATLRRRVSTAALTIPASTTFAVHDTMRLTGTAAGSTAAANTVLCLNGAHLMDNPTRRVDNETNTFFSLGDFLVSPENAENLVITGVITAATINAVGGGNTCVPGTQAFNAAVAFGPASDTTTANIPVAGLLVTRGVNQTTAQAVTDLDGTGFVGAGAVNEEIAAGGPKATASLGGGLELREGITSERFTPYDTLLTVSLAADPTYGERGAPTTSQKIFGFVVAASLNSKDPRNQEAAVRQLILQLNGSADIANIELFNASDDVSILGGPIPSTHAGNSAATNHLFDLNLPTVDTRHNLVTEGQANTYYVEADVRTFTFDQSIAVAFNDFGDEDSNAITAVRSDLIWSDCNTNCGTGLNAAPRPLIYWIDQSPNDLTPPPQTFTSAGGSATLDTTRPLVTAVTYTNGATSVAGSVDTGDLIAVTFSEPIDPSVFTPADSTQAVNYNGTFVSLAAGVAATTPGSVGNVQSDISATSLTVIGVTEITLGAAGSAADEAFGTEASLDKTGTILTLRITTAAATVAALAVAAPNVLDGDVGADGDVACGGAADPEATTFAVAALAVEGIKDPLNSRPANAGIGLPAACANFLDDATVPAGVGGAT